MKIINYFIILLLFSGTVLAQDPAGEGKVYRAVVDKEGVQRIDILGGTYFYRPDHIIVKLNIPVELKVKKEPGIIPHNIVIDQPEAGMVVRESLNTKGKVIRFTPAKTGKYPFYCDKRLLFFKSHRKKGMEGIIEVVE